MWPECERNQRNNGNDQRRPDEEEEDDFQRLPRIDSNFTGEDEEDILLICEKRERSSLLFA